MLMNARTQDGVRVSRKLAVLLLLVCNTSVSGGLRVSADSDADGVFDKIRSYPISYEEALTAFAETGGAPWDGTGTVLNAREIPGVSFSGPQSWDGFIAFLDRRYSAGAVATSRRCDDSIAGRFVWDCDAPWDCTPVTDCEGHANAYFTDFACRVRGDPVCPDAKDFCTPTGTWPEVQSFSTWGGPACHCPTGEGGPCVVNTNAHVRQVLYVDELLCTCTWYWRVVPTVSEWGLIVLTLLGMTIGTVTYARRRVQTVARAT